MSGDLGLRRHALPDPDEAGEESDLVQRIRDEVERDGPMPFVRFMELALYDPEGGYYRGAEPRPGRAGDFITAPELHPIFGATLAAAVLETWERLDRPRPFIVREHGAGTGALAGPLLGALRPTDLWPSLRYVPIEVDPRRLAALTERLERDGLAAALVDPPATPGSGPGLVLANEVLDALPVHRVRRHGTALREVAVIVSPEGAFAETEIDPTTTALAARLAADGIELEDGQTAEICLALDAWLAEAARPLDRGLLVLIDYGYPAVELYDPRRRRHGTLRAYLRQRVHDDPYRHVGRQDLTAHVDLTAVERAARGAGLDLVGSTTQAEALMGLGIEERLRAIQADPGTDAQAYLEVRAALMRLLDPAAMGRFRVLAFGRDWPPDAAPLGMFRYRLPERAASRHDRP